MLLILCTLLMILASANYIMLLKYEKLLDKILGIFVLAIAQIILTVLLTGVIGQLTIQMLVLVTILQFIISLTVIYCFTKNLKLICEFWIELLKQVKEVKVTSRAVIILVFIVICQIAWLGILIYIFPPYAYDGLMYHLVSVADWIQTHTIGITPYIEWTNVYPQHGGLIYTWLVIFLKSDIIVESGQLVFGIMAAIATIGIARNLRVKREYAIASGCIFFLTPIVIAQAITNYVDLMFAAMFLIFFYFYLRYMDKFQKKYVLLAGIAAGITLGIKSSAAAYIGICVIIVFIELMIRIYKKKCLWREVLIHMSIFTIAAILLGGFWYFRTWIVYGNPVYPFTVQLGDWVIFEGKGSMHDMIMVSNTPEAIRAMNKFQQIIYSWKHLMIKPSYDQGLGGLGIFWVFLGLPSMLITSIYYVIKERRRFIIVLLPAILIFLIQPSSWWSRYTLYIVAFGSCCFMYLVGKINYKYVKQSIMTICIMMILIMTYLGHDHIFYNIPYVEQVATWPKENRTLGKTIRQEYGWVDDLPEGSIIASTTMNPFMYPLFGEGYTNKVIPLDNIENQMAFEKILDSNKIEFVFIKQTEDYDQWLQNNEKYKLIHQVWEYNLYRLIK